MRIFQRCFNINAMYEEKMFGEPYAIEKEKKTKAVNVRRKKKKKAPKIRKTYDIKKIKY